MKRVETISINGIVFSIDDDAYVQLGSYIDILSKHFEQEPGGRDIVADIEARISELFAQREGGVSRVVTIDDVAKVIETLGAPEVITGDDANGMPDSEKPQQQPQSKKTPKRLYRDTDRRYLGGVCAGIGAWFGTTPAAIRLVFVFLSFLLFIYAVHSGNFFKFFPVLIYLIFWIIIPKAKTTAQKLEMHGEPVNISTIEKNIRESFSDPSLKRSFREFLDEAGEFLTKVFGVFGRIIGFFAGLGLFFWGIVLTFGLISLFFMQDFIFNNRVEWDFLSFTELFRHIIFPASYVILLICTILTVALFIMALLFWGMRLMSGFNKVKHKLFHVAMAVVWIAAIVTGIITTVSQVRKFAWNNEPIVETHYIAHSDTLYIAMAPSGMQISNNPMDIYFDKDNKCFYGKPNLYVRKSEDDRIRLRTSRKSQGESKRDAYRYAENIEYKVDIRDSSVVFNPYFTVTPSDRWKFQTLDITLFVPEGIVIVADPALCRDRMLRRRFNNCIFMFADE